ncbi:hypothetical protein B9Z55_021038 [Caenorhabditis nigoni]|nr:hypothetical protein B9Z55_021038 [Caenorhabditis nigoni]
MAGRTIRLKSPKLGCVPIRPFLIFISFLGILGAPSLLITKQCTTTTIISCAMGIAFNGCLFYGALKYNDKALWYCEKLLILSMMLWFLIFCFTPVFVTSLIASDYYKYKKAEISGSPLKIHADEEETTVKQTRIDFFDMKSFSEIARKIPERQNKTKAEDKFASGFVAGQIVVFMIVFSALYIYMVYVMIKRLRKFIAGRREIDENEFLA